MSTFPYRIIWFKSVNNFLRYYGILCTDTDRQRSSQYLPKFVGGGKNYSISEMIYNVSSGTSTRSLPHSSLVMHFIVVVRQIFQFTFFVTS